MGVVWWRPVLSHQDNIVCLPTYCIIHDATHTKLNSNHLH